MNQEYFQASNWYRAVTLTERIISQNTEQSQKSVNKDLAQHRLNCWQNQTPFNTDSYFAERLELDDISQEQFFSLLGESIDAVKERFPKAPSWLIQLNQAFSDAVNRDDRFQLPKSRKNPGIEKFLYSIEPLINQGCRRLSEEIQKLSQEQSELPFDPETIVEMLLPHLTRRLLQMLNRTLVLELNVARLQGLLKGDTPQERFQSFIERLRQPDVALSILQEYPVLARQISICVNYWVRFSLEFLQHLSADWDEIKATFSPDRDPGLLAEVNSNAGDIHRGGRSVMLLKFSSGFQLVYKPRSLAVDVHFQQLLTWLNQRGDLFFRTIKVLDRTTYGWLEFVKTQSCTKKEEVQRFYERQGGYLALLYALQATDFHSENLIAVGEHPILIDLESLFHPTVGELDTSKANLLAGDKMAYSVLGIGLLPNRIWGDDKSDGIDLSGLGSKEGQLTLTEIPYWEEAGTDQMRLKRKKMEMPGTQNRPTLNGNNVNLLDYTEEITNGFTNIYQLLIRYRDELLSADGPIAAFAKDEVRVIIRPTRFYGVLLNESFHPDLLRDALERDRHFERLWYYVKYKPSLKQVIPAERQDLLHGDIPMFVSRPNSRDVWSSSGQQIDELLKEPSLDMVYRRLQQLGDLDMAQQLWFIRASLATVHLGLDEVNFPSYPILEPQTIVDREQLIAAARVIGDRLDFLAIRGEEDASWIGLTFSDEPEPQWFLVSLGLDLYDGLPGIILFLAYLGAVTEEERYTNLARAALITVRSQIEEFGSDFKQIGAFGGWGGIIYTLIHLAVLWNQPDLLTEAEKVVEYLPDLIEQDTQFGIISGAAGCISSLLALYRCKPAKDTLNVAIKCGDLLIARAEMLAHGIGWIWENGSFKSKQPLTGFSHGAAGIASSLLELAAVTGEQRFATTALAAIEYERSQFLPEAENWIDLRHFTNTVLEERRKRSGSCRCAWCHGAPGIGLARLRSLSQLDNPEIRAEIDTALKTTIAKRFGTNHSLCHGDLGNLELLLQASLTLDDPQWKKQAKRFAGIVLGSINKNGWLCSAPSGLETPGLMTGLAGIGYGLLRLAIPEYIPSILVLEPPKVRNENFIIYTS
ncbi:MAG: type 2 lanthipeptide synthetase LanM family protein [Pleurocapsa sp. MO_192.B19]|nr:type 2 lanthipeptide synthetase LanM family protein [Pleurocapsa sp. MO_192.B19]